MGIIRDTSVFGRLKKPFRWKNFRENEDGTAAIEFSAVALPFLLIVFMIAQFSYNFLATRMLNAGVDNASRLLKTGQLQGAGSEAAFRQSFCNDGVMFLFDCNALVVDVQSQDVFSNKPIEYDDDGNIDDSEFEYSPGGPQTINLVRVYYQMPAFLNWRSLANFISPGVYTDSRVIQAANAFMSEPFTPQTSPSTPITNP